ncbi:hypothetical protein GCM10027403_12280 [Arthrobacter tecti]
MSSLTSDLLAGGVSFLWYALPDVVERRPPRTLAKVGLLIGAGAFVFHEIRRERRLAGILEKSQVKTLTIAEPPDAPTLNGDKQSGDMTPMSPRGVVATSAVVILMLGLTVTSARTERAIFTYGENLSKRGVAWPHTRIGLVLGLVTTVFSLGMSRVERAARVREPAPGR